LPDWSIVLARCQAMRSIEDGPHPNMANMVIYENDKK
jgi:hypothetical protein